MNPAAIPLSIALGVMSGGALAEGASDPIAHLRACFQMEGTERLECLEKLSRNIAPPARPAPEGNNWIVSETTSPVDYTPIVIAVTYSRDDADGSPLQLSIHCRGGRTELVVAGSAISRISGPYTILYRINDDQPVQLAAALPSFGSGAAFTGDVVRLLLALPEEGRLAIRLSTRAGAALSGNFLLNGLSTVREKVAAACNWPHAVAKPRS